MQLKEYQVRVLDELSAYLRALRDPRKKYDKYAASEDEDIRELARKYDFCEEAWKATRGEQPYSAKRDGLGAPLPDVYLKVPTGGGKTLLACHAIGRITGEYLLRRAGLVLWVVPSEQIYKQTLQRLNDREHPYRQVLDVVSGGRTFVRERTQIFTPTDADGKLVVMLLMLQAANRQSKETLKMFEDAGPYQSFFPDELDYAAHAEMLRATPNYDKFPANEALNAPPLIKTSLGNVLRKLRPLIIVDEGQKAYSAIARDTLTNFNPAFMLELSATPPKESNVVAAASGRDLRDEQMIKLPIELLNESAGDWKRTLLAGYERRRHLEKTASKHQQNGGRYIRPIMLIQVERTGSDQRDGKAVHAEDARDELMRKCGVQAHEIAIQSATRKELTQFADLMADDCPIRYIITKQALQEGWDCAFAYVLTVLSNLTAKTALTQLVGRILRQPQARLTGERELDQCYVFTRHSEVEAVVGHIQAGLMKEGLGDLQGAVSANGAAAKSPARVLTVRDKFKHFIGRLYLPQFAVQTPDGRWRPLDYESDILARLPWDELKVDVDKFALDPSPKKYRALVQDEKTVEYAASAPDGVASADPTLMTRQLTDAAPNPWRAHEQTRRVLDELTKRDGADAVNANFLHIISRANDLLKAARDELAEKHFKKQVAANKIKLVLLRGKGSWRIPARIEVHTSEKRLVRADNTNLQKSFFDKEMADNFDTDLEREVALYLDDHARLLWWYRNRTGAGDYRLQGWRRGRVYPDFVLMAQSEGDENGLDKVMVIETKGEHLVGADDAEYKRKLLDFCTEQCARGVVDPPASDAPADAVGESAEMRLDDKRGFVFQMVNQDEWRDALGKMLNP